MKKFKNFLLMLIFLPFLLGGKEPTLKFIEIAAIKGDKAVATAKAKKKIKPAIKKTMKIRKQNTTWLLTFDTEMKGEMRTFNVSLKKKDDRLYLPVVTTNSASCGGGGEKIPGCEAKVCFETTTCSNPIGGGMGIEGCMCEGAFGGSSCKSDTAGPGGYTPIDAGEILAN